MFRDLLILLLRDLKTTSRNPVFLIMGVVVPITYLTLFAPLLKNIGIDLPDGNVLNLFVPGMLPIIAFSAGLFTGFGMIDQLRSGIIERFRVTPVSRFAILGGPVFHDVTAALFQALLFVLIALPFGFRANLFGLVILFLLLALLAMITSSFGNAVGVITKSEDRYAPIVHAINLPILLLSGVLLPMTLAPKWLLVASHFNPVYYVVEASRSLAAGEIANQSVLMAFVILIPFAVVTMAWANQVFKRATT